MSVILGVDPGPTSGFAIWANYDFLSSRGDFLAESFEEWIEEFKVWALPQGREDMIDEVVVEDYVGGGRQSAEGLFTTKLVGVVIALCYEWGLPLTVQTPGVRAPFRPEALESGKLEKHAIDAGAHVLAKIFRDKTKGETSG